MSWVGIVLIGIGVGFLAGLFGKGGSAVATPLLHAVGVPALVALAAPLPATVPSTLVALTAYWRQGLVDRQVVRWSAGVGVPATVAGAIATRWISGSTLVLATDVLVAGLGLRLLLWPHRPGEVIRGAPGFRTRLVAIAAVTGAAAGLLANSGGFLLAPLYLVGLRLPLKAAFASSLAVSAVLAVPGTAVHALLGHVDWTVVAAFAAGSVPSSYLGARSALGADARRLERVFGGLLTALGVGFLAWAL